MVCLSAEPCTFLALLGTCFALHQTSLANSAQRKRLSSFTIQHFVQANQDDAPHIKAPSRPAAGCAFIVCQALTKSTEHVHGL